MAGSTGYKQTLVNTNLYLPLRNDHCNTGEFGNIDFTALRWERLKWTQRHHVLFSGGMPYLAFLAMVILFGT